MSTDDQPTTEDTLAAQQAALFEAMADNAAAAARHPANHYVEAQARDLEAHARTLAEGLAEEGDDLNAEWVHAHSPAGGPR